MATGPNPMPLVQVQVAFASNPLSGTYTWVDVSQYVRNVEITRGRQHVLNNFEPGRLTVTLDGRDGSFDPTNPSSTYYPNVDINRRVQVLAWWNLLTAAQGGATITGGWTGTNCTLTYPSGMVLTASSTGGLMSAQTPTGSSGFTVSPNAFYTGMASFQASSTSRSAYTTLWFYNSAGTWLASSTGAPVTSASTGATQALVNAVAPSTARYGALTATVASSASGENHTVTQAAVEPGRVVYSDIVLADNPSLYYRLNDATVNLLRAGDANFASGVGTWVALNGTIAGNATAGAVDGLSAKVTATSTNDLYAQLSTTALYVPVTPGQVYSASVYAQYAAGTARSCRVGVQFFNSSGGSTSGGLWGASAVATAAWRQFTVASQTAPATSAYMVILVEALSAVSGDAILVSNALVNLGTNITYSDPTTTVADSSTSGNTGTIHGGVSEVSPGAVTGGGATLFDGGTGYVTSNSTVTAAKTNVTVEAWVYVPDALHHGCVALVGVGTSGYGIGVGNTTFNDAGNKLIAVFEGVRWIATGATLSVGWHLVHLVLNGSGYPTVYLDGVSVHSDTTNAAPLTAAGTLYIGKDPNNPTTSFWGSDIAEVAVYTTALSASQIAAHYSASTLPATSTPSWYAGGGQPIYTGFTDSWVPQWHDNLNTDVVMTASDGLRLLAQARFGAGFFTPLAVTDGASYLFPLNEAAGTAAAIDTITGETATYSGATLGQTGISTVDSNTSASFALSGGALSRNFKRPGAYSAPLTWSIETWFKTGANVATNLVAYGRATGLGNYVELSLASSGQVLGFQGVSTSVVTSPSTYRDNAWHQAVVVSDNNASSAKLYVDGALSASAASSQSMGGDGNTYYQLAVGPNGTGGPVQMAYTTYYTSTALSATQVSNHYQAGTSGIPSTDSATYQANLLAQATWPTADESLSSPGQSTIQAPASALAGTPVLSDMQTVSKSENGALFVNGSGKVVFQNRYTILTGPNNVSAATFGDASSNEISYKPSPTFALDNLDFYNISQVTRVGGAMQTASSGTSITNYGASSSPLMSSTLTESGLLITTDSESLARAQWNVGHYATPITRVRGLTVDVTADTVNRFPQTVFRELRDRVTVNRRPYTKASGWPGSQFSQDSYIEGISHRIDPRAGTWAVSLALSPAETQAYWLLGDPTFGVLGSTTRLAYRWREPSVRPLRGCTLHRDDGRPY